jgi:hypothetical protein
MNFLNNLIAGIFVSSVQFIYSDVPFSPVVTYGVEIWTMTKKEEKALLNFERKIFRRIYGPKYEDGEWKSRTNRELEELNKGENIVKWIKGKG